MLKGLKSLFIVEEEAPRNDSAADDAPERPEVTPLNDRRSAGPVGGGAAPGPQPRSEASAVAKTQGTVNTDIVAKLLDGIDRNDLEGFDYLEYKRSLKAMESFPMDEATKYRSAFATASTVGATQDKLLSSVEYYLQILDQEKTQFDAVVDRQFADQVAGRKTQLDEIERGIDTRTQQIARLTSEIEDLRQRANEIGGSLSDSETKIANTKLDFEASFAYVKNLFVQDAEKMRRYLK